MLSSFLISLINIHYCQQANCSFNDSNKSDIESYFDFKNEKSNLNTNLTDIDIDIKRDNKIDIL